MKISFLDHDVASWIKPRETPPRTVGLHVSDVLVRMLKALPGKKYDRYGRAVDGERKPAFEVGYLWEDVIREHLQQRVEVPQGYTLIPPTEISRGGLYGSPDRLLWHDQTFRFTDDETKATWMSCNGLDARPEALTENAKFTYWLLQSKTYAAMLLRYTTMPNDAGGVDLVALPDDVVVSDLYGGGIGPGVATLLHERRAIDTPPIVNIRALFLNGDYRGTLATAMCWQLEYTADELEDWWSAVMAFKDTLITPEGERRDEPTAPTF